MGDYVRLRRGNSWGADYFAIEPLENGLAKAERGIICTDGEIAPVRWSDGAEGTAAIRVVSESFTVGDMGHNYKGTIKIPHVVAMIHGTEALLRIDAVELDRAWAIAHGAK